MPFSLTIIAVASATAGALYYQHLHKSVSQAPIPAIPGVPTPQPNATFAQALPTPDQAEAATPMIFRVVSDDSGSHLKMIRMKASDAVGDPGVPTAIVALNAMAEGDDSPLPPGTKALSYKTSDDGETATVDFNEAFVKNFSGGDSGEALAIESILATVGQFGVKSVQITVEGKKIDSLGGNESLMNPLPVPQSAGAQPEQTAEKGGTAP